MSLLKSSIAPVALVAALAGCQAVYPTQYVPYSPLTTEYKSDSYDFKVVDLTPTAAMEANQVWSYTPRPAPLGLRSDAAPATALTVRATTLGESDDSYLIAQVAQNVDTVSSAADLRDPPPSPARPYRIGVGDVFTVTIEQLNAGAGGTRAFQSTTTVDYAGNIYLTDVGEVQVVDLTVADARQTIADRFRDARLSANGSATVTGFNSQKVLVSSPGKSTSFLPITNTPITLRNAYLRNSSGIDKDAQRQVVVLRRDGQNYSTRGLNILRQTYGYDVYLRDGDEIQIFDSLLDDYQTASVSGEVLALRRAEFERTEADRNQRQFEAAERRADRQDQRAAESAQIARENAELARQNAARLDEQLQIARQNAQLAQTSEARAQLEQARADRDEARRAAADARAQAAEARLERDQARLDARDARERAADSRSARQLALAELSNTRGDRTTDLSEKSAGRDLARTRLDLGIEGQDRIFVAGEVGKQQTIPMPFDRHFSLAEAIYGAEGLEPITGDPSRIYVVRVKSSVAGSVESYIFHFDSGNLANTPAMTMFQMRPDDYVVIFPRAITNWSRFVTQLVPTLNSVVSAARLGV